MAKTSLSFDELRNKARGILLRDSSKLSGTNYAPYPGKTIAPMSALTQRAQALEQRRLSKGMPYQGGLQSLANANAEGLTRENIADILRNLNEKHSSFNDGRVFDKLNRQYGSSFAPYSDKLKEKMAQDSGIKLQELGSDIENLNAPIRELEGKKNRSAFTALTQSAKAKEAREKGLISDLYGYGEQKHGIVNKGLTAEKARFEAERNDPYVRLQNLQQVLDTIGGESEEMLSHPDLAQMNAQQLVKALQAYGIDTNKPFSEWESSSRVNMPVYQGKLVEPINPTMDRSYKLAEELSPFYKDKNYLDRKLVRKNIENIPNSINQVVGNLPEQLKAKFEALDYEGQKKLEADLNALNAKYIRQGTYGSGAHLKSVSNRIRELSDATLTSRGNLVKNDLLKNIASKHHEDINKIGKLGQYDQLANTELGNTLGEIKSTNLKGLEKWKNDQENNEQLYKSYQNEKAFAQPMLLNNARGTGYASGVEGGINTVFNHFNNQGIDLSSISDLQGRYSELEKELASRNEAIKSAEDYKSRQEELARQNMSEFEREKTQRLSLEREKGELNERLLREIETRKALEQDFAKKQELDRQYQDMLKKGEEAKRLKLEEDRRLAEEERLAKIARDEAERQRQQKVEEYKRQEQANILNRQRIEQQVRNQRITELKNQIATEEKNLVPIQWRRKLAAHLGMDYHGYDQDKQNIALLEAKIAELQKRLQGI
jgi:hypothetical protein